MQLLNMTRDWMREAMDDERHDYGSIFEDDPRTKPHDGQNENPAA